MEKRIDTGNVCLYYDAFAEDNPEVFNEILLELLALIKLTQYDKARWLSSASLRI